MNLLTLAISAALLLSVYGNEENKPLDQNETISPRKNGFRFEDDPEFSFLNDNNSIKFEDHPEIPIKFEETTLNDKPGPVTFQDHNRVEDNSHKKKRRRRRRKPRNQLGAGQFGQFPGEPFPGQAYPFPDQPYPGQVPYPGLPGSPLPGPSLPGQGPVPGFGQQYPEGVSGYGQAGARPPGQFYRPPRRPKPSFASEALSTVTGALTSIALYDDYQCVPRLLCEAAGGGALGTSNVLQSVAGLQPLLTLLSAYSGISTSPLFVFGRAVFLGMTSKGNTASCRYAYPQCPTDTEQLVHYLNNHNGGFFRFFNAPQQQIPQNLEQFYNQLSGYGLPQPNPQQNYGIYDPQNSAQQLYNPYQNPQNPQYGPQDLQNSPGNFNSQTPQQYGLYTQPNNQQYGFQPLPPNTQQVSPYQPGPGQQNYGFYSPQYYQTPQPNPYGLYNQFGRPQNPYANKFGYGYNKKRKQNKKKYGFSNIRFKDNGDESNRIEKRIQNKPNYVYVDSNIANEDEDSVNNLKWIFPNDYYVKENVVTDNVRVGKILKFPDENAASEAVVSDTLKKKDKSIIFPESQSNRYLNYYEYPPVNNANLQFQYQNYNVGSPVITTNLNYNQYANDNTYKHQYNNHFYNDDNEIQTVYIVRDDPNNPEIVKVRRGQKIM